MADAYNQKEVKFGLDQLTNPTPAGLKYFFRGYTFLAGLWALFAPALTHIPADTMAEINKWVLIGVPAIQYTIKFFGLDYKEN